MKLCFPSAPFLSMAKGSKPIETEASLPATAQDEVKASSERGRLPQTRDYH
jgi:hypothetical protein